MEAVASILILAGMVVFLASLVAVFKPLPSVWLSTRKHAVVGILASMAGCITGGSMMPDKPDRRVTSSVEVVSESQAVQAEPERLIQPVSNVTHLHASEILREFNANPIRAERKYDGKRLIVSGRISSIEDGFFGKASLRLEGPDMFNNLNAVFDDENELIDLEIGQDVVIECRNAESGMIGARLSDCTMN